MKPLPRRPRATQSAPEVDHAIMSEGDQSRFLGRSIERTKNLGHDSTVDRLTGNPARPTDYERGPVRQIVDEKRYQKFSDPKAGRSTQENLDKWASYARSNSYSVDGRGRDPKGRGAGSDNHLLSTKGWANLPDSGADSGPSRIEKAKRY